ncbi:MAG: hypothetical protein M0R76_11735 [Proteobacteria bacterium]|nr:hypothetical protein [Pseudomonadota bacterium]
MKHLAILVSILALLMLATACDDLKGPAFASGSGYINPPGFSGPMSGSLGTSGSQDLYGFCQYKNGVFTFEVGHDDLTHLGDAMVAQPRYFRFNGITGPNGGPPVQGIFSEELDIDGNPKIKSGAAVQSTFKNAVIKAKEAFSFDGDKGNCTVELFAEAAPGELIPELNKTFQYYVSIYCAGMEEVAGSLGSPLSIVEVKFYFDNCD